MSEKTINILIIDDDESDQDMVIDILKECDGRLNISTLDDGVEVMDYLRKRNNHELAVTPDLILLDLNMPLRDGRDVLNDIKNDKAFACVPVIILSTSVNETDICESYRNGANAYVQKRTGLEGFTKSISQLERFWINTVKLPVGCNSQPGSN